MICIPKKIVSDWICREAMNEQDAEDYFKRGKAYYDRGNYDAAIEDLNKAFEIDPDNEEAKKLAEEIEKQSGKSW